MNPPYAARGNELAARPLGEGLKPNFRGPGPDGQRRRSILLRGLCAAAGPLLMFKAGQPVLRENLSGFTVAIQTICCRLAVRKLPACCKKDRRPPNLRNRLDDLPGKRRQRD